MVNEYIIHKHTAMNDEWVRGDVWLKYKCGIKKYRNVWYDTMNVKRI